MHTDEYQISLNREIGVCRSRISAAQKELSRLEKTYGLTTRQVLDGGDGAAIPGKERARWREEAAVLAVWSNRLREYEDLYNNSKM